MLGLPRTYYTYFFVELRSRDSVVFPCLHERSNSTYIIATRMSDGFGSFPLKPVLYIATHEDKYYQACADKPYNTFQIHIEFPSATKSGIVEKLAC